MLIKHITEQEEAREMLEKRRVERWIIEKETELLQKQIEERNRIFETKLNRQIQAAISIQRAFRNYRRLKKDGISMTQILQ